MDVGLDLSSDDVTESEIPVDDEQAADELLAGLDEPADADAESALDDAMEGFSLDDFAPDSLDEEEPPKE